MRRGRTLLLSRAWPVPAPVLLAATSVVALLAPACASSAPAPAQSPAPAESAPPAPSSAPIAWMPPVEEKKEKEPEPAPPPPTVEQASRNVMAALSAVDVEDRARDREEREKRDAAMRRLGSEGSMASVFGDSGAGLGSMSGFGGLGLRGTGIGGGGGGTIGLGSIGGAGRGGGAIGTGSGMGFGGPPSSPTVRAGQATVSGALDKDVGSRVIRRVVANVRACYDTVLATQPAAAGTVTVRVEVAADGKVTKATLRTTLPGGTIATCVESGARRLTFPTATATSVVEQTYTLAPPAKPAPKPAPAPAPKPPAKKPLAERRQRPRGRDGARARRIPNPPRPARRLVCAGSADPHAGAPIRPLPR